MTTMTRTTTPTGLFCILRTCWSKDGQVVKEQLWADDFRSRADAQHAIDAIGETRWTPLWDDETFSVHPQGYVGETERKRRRREAARAKLAATLRGGLGR